MCVFPRWENAQLSENSCNEFSSHAFSRCILPREFSRRELPRCIFFPRRESSRCKFLVTHSLSLFLHLDISVFFVVHFLVANSLSSCIFPSYLSLNTFFPEHLFYRGFSRYTPVYFLCFLTCSLPHTFFHHPLLHHDFSRSSFSCRKFLLFFCCIFFFSETISIANLPMNPSILIFFILVLLYEPSFLVLSLSVSLSRISH